jgi:hypothetical protein
MQSKFDAEAQHQIKSTNKVVCISVVDQSTMTKRAFIQSGKTSLMLLATHFNNRDAEMERFIELAAKHYDDRPYLFDMVSLDQVKDCFLQSHVFDCP